MPDDKPRPDFSNVRSGGSSTAPPAPAASPAGTTPPATPSPAAPRTYTVVAGDSLSKIAKHFYGDANQWKRIFDANRDTIKNPDLIRPGQVLKIPDA
jgi:nucleoid-associated protein YgaU